MSSSDSPCILFQVLASPFMVMRVLAENFGYLVWSILIIILVITIDYTRLTTVP